MEKVTRLIARIRAWLAWRGAKAEPARINRPAPLPVTPYQAPPALAELARRPCIFEVDGRFYFRDRQGNAWRVNKVLKDDAGGVRYIVGKLLPRVADPATRTVGPCRRVS